MLFASFGKIQEEVLLGARISISQFELLSNNNRILLCPQPLYRKYIQGVIK